MKGRDGGGREGGEGWGGGKGWMGQRKGTRREREEGKEIGKKCANVPGRMSRAR